MKRAGTRNVIFVLGLKSKLQFHLSSAQQLVARRLEQALEAASAHINSLEV